MTLTYKKDIWQRSGPVNPFVDRTVGWLYFKLLTLPREFKHFDPFVRIKFRVYEKLTEYLATNVLKFTGHIYAPYIPFTSTTNS
jgi:hypothetical protein